MHSRFPVKTPYDIRERTFLFGCRTIDFCKSLLERPGVLRELGRQFLHSGTSIGANLEEAGAGESKPDFRHKVSISRKEAFESRYWLRLIVYSEEGVSSAAAPLIQECTELIAILTTIRKNAESSSDRG